MTSLDFLQNVVVLKGLIDSQLARIEDQCREMEFRQNAKLFSEGDDASCLWIVKEGRVDLRFDLPDRPTSTKNTISSISEYMSFGWSSLVAPHKYRLSAYCATKSCKVIQIEREALAALFKQDSKTGYVVMSNLVEVIGQRFRQLQDLASKASYASIKVTVHLATCGIVAGAREVMSTLMEEMALTDRPEIEVKSGGCIGNCETHPNVTVEIEGEDPVVYQKMNADKMRQVFKQHLLMGKVQTDYALA
ncbi:MAG: cyclic nucleotide-binding domain-containing protein [Desulfobacterales bacterium]|nr:MAG: cyclic nucleotide-binding domain-containing protein [Desulfobacterales bacterium]